MLPRALLLVLWIAPNTLASQSSWDRYKVGTIRGILAQEHDAVLHSLQNGLQHNTIISAKDFATLATVVYEDSIRPTPDVRLDVINNWAKGFQVNMDPRPVFAREVLVREDTTLYWLATEDTVIGIMRRDLKRGEPIEAYVAYVGAEGGRGPSIDWVLLLNDFRALSSAPPPSQRELNGYLIGQHATAIAAGFAKVIQVDTTSDGWVYRTYLLDRAHHAYMSFKFPKDRPDFTVSVQVAGDSGTPMHPFLGIRLGDHPETLAAHVRKPTQIEHEENDLNLDLYTYDNRNYSFELDSLHRVSSIEIFGDDGFPDLPADPIPSLDSLAQALAAGGVVALEYLAPDLEVYRAGTTIRFRGSALMEVASDTTPMFKTLFQGPQSVTALLNSPGVRRAARGAIRLWDQPPAGWVWKFSAASGLDEVVLKVILGRWRVWQIRYR
jgi:hypothetical protein